MLTYRDMIPSDEALATRLMNEFYHTDAVCTPAPPELIARNIQAALDPREPAFRGVLVEQDGETVGYFMLTTFYSGEAAGICVMIEQVFVCGHCRGQGIGQQMMAWLPTAYPHARRFQLEVSEGNPGASRMYEKCGFQLNPYQTMYINRQK